VPLRLLLLLSSLVVAACGVSLIEAGTHDRSPQSQVLPAAEFSVDPRARPPIPTDPAKPLPGNARAAGGTTVPRPCNPRLSPAHVVIARLCISALFVPTSTTASGLVIPADVHRVGIWDGGEPLAAGRVAGRGGTTLVAGHVDYYNQGNGAFHDLYLVQPGELITTVDASGATGRWRAISLGIYNKSALPDSVWAAKAGPRRLVLVTCGGPLLHVPGQGGAYEDNVIVTAVPA
jgi:hypothetical protein